MALVVPEFLPTKTYPAARLRDMLSELALQEGVYDAGSMKASPRAAGADRSVDVAVGAALLTGDDTARQGSYKHYNDAVVNVPATVNASGNPRVDQLILQNFDSSVLGSSDTPQYQILAGTPAAGAQIFDPAAASYRAGAASLPPSALRIAEWTAANGYAAITNADIIDRRSFARGALWQAIQTFATLSTNSITHVLLSALLQRRIECSGVPTVAHLHSPGIGITAGAPAFVYTQLFVDSAPVGPEYLWYISANSGYQPCAAETVFTPTIGHHIVEWRWRVSSAAATGSFLGGMVDSGYRELVRQNV